MRRPRTYRYIALAVVGIFLGGVIWSALLGSQQQLPPIAPLPDPAPPAQPPSEPPAPQYDYELILEGGLIYDGTGGPPFVADVAIIGDRIFQVGDMSRFKAMKRISVKGLVVAPGFIDVHSHTYEYDDPLSMSAVSQGITTQIGGVDGRHHGYLAGGQNPRPVRVGEALAALNKGDEGTGVNQALFAGIGTIRHVVMGEGSGRPTAEQMAKLKEMVREAMLDGALGISSGLDYVPDRYFTTAEIVQLAREAAELGGIYATHTRGDFANVKAGVEEALRIGREANIPVAIQHMKFVGPSEWRVFDEVMAMIDAAVAAGQKVSIDLYPYQAPDFATRIPLAEALQRVGGDASLVEINVSPRDASLVGRRLSAIASDRGVPAEALAAQLTADGVRGTPELMRLEHILAMLKKPYALTDSDGEAAPEMDEHAALRQGGAGVHPRSYGAYPRFLRLNREHNLMPLEELIRKMTGAAADFYNLKDRGYIRSGAFADIVVFDPAKVREHATFSSPQEWPEGIVHVLVNGRFVIEYDFAHETRPGRGLLRGR